MGKRYTCTAPSYKGISYTIEIYDSVYAGGVTTFKAGPDLFTLNYANENGKRWTPIVGSELSFTFYVEDAGGEQFMADIASGTINRFTVKVLSGASIFWTGIITPNSTERDDYDYPISFEIRATCGISILKNIPYLNSGALYTGVASFKSHLVNALSKLGTAALYGGSDVFLRTSVDWWDTNVTVSNGTDPLDKYGVDHWTFYQFHTTGGVEEDVMSCYEVISEVCKAMGSRIYMMNGAFWVEQISYKTGNFVSRNYTKTGTYLTFNSFSGANVLNRTTTGARNIGGGGYFSYYPALRRVDVNYHSFARYNLFVGSQFVSNLTVQDVSRNITYDITDNSGTTTLKITGNMPVQITNNSFVVSAQNPVNVVFKARIEFGGYRWTNTFTRVNNGVYFSTGAWTAAGLGGYFYYQCAFNSLPAIGAKTSNFTPISIITGPMIATGGSQVFSIELDSVQKAYQIFSPETATITATSGPTGSPLDLDIAYTVENIWIEVFDDGTADLREDIITYPILGDVDNYEKETVDVRIGGSVHPNLVGRVRRYNGSAWVDATTWGTGGGTKLKTISALLGQIIIQGQNINIRKMRTTAFGSLTLYKRYTTDGVNWLMMGGRWNAQRDEFTGEFFELNYGPEGIASTPVKVISTGGIKHPTTAGGGNGTVTVGTPTTSGNPGFNVSFPPSVLDPLKNNTTAAAISSGASITSLSVSVALSGNDYAVGDTITIVNPVTGQKDDLTVTAAPTAGAFSMTVSGTATAAYPQGAFLIKKPIAYAFSLPATTVGSVLRYNASTSAWEAYNGATNGHVLTWNNSTSKWEAAAPASGYTDEQAQDAVGTILTDTTTIDLTYNDGTPSITADVKANSISNALFRKSASLSIVGNATNTNPADVDDITAASDNQVLRRSGTALGFGAINLASSNAVTGTLPIGNGGTGLTAVGTALQLLRTNSAANALEYFTFAGITGSLTSGRVPFASGGSTLTDDGDFTWDNTNKRLVIGSGTSAAQINLFPSATTGTIENIRASGNTNGEMRWNLWNAWNGSGLGSSMLNIRTGNGTNGNTSGDPFILFQSGTTGTYPRYAMGIDRSDGSKFKISVGQDTLGATVSKSFVITNSETPAYGFNVDAPQDRMHIDGRVRALNYYNTGGTPLIVVGAGAGTGATATVSGGPNFMLVTLNTGTTPSVNQVIFTVTYSNAFAAGSQILIMDGDGLYRDHISRFYRQTISGSAVTVTNRVTALQASSTYVIYLLIGAWT